MRARVRAAKKLDIYLELRNVKCLFCFLVVIFQIGSFDYKQHATKILSILTFLTENSFFIF